MKVKVYILFYWDNSWIITFIEMKCGVVKYYEHTYKFYLNSYFVW
jgi:hypothetical protein